MQRYIDFIERINYYKTNKRIIIWGAGLNGRQIHRLLSLHEINVEYFVDTRHDEDRVFPPDRLLSENKQEFLVVVSPHHIPYILDIDEKLEKWGWQKGENYINFVTDDVIEANRELTYFDPFLGFSQIRDIEGFQIYGVEEKGKRIIVLGNCTSVPNKLSKIWVDYLSQSNQAATFTIYNGACAGYSSSQELLKLIRDVLILNPDILIVFNGVIDATNANRQPGYPYYTKYEYNLLEQCFDDKAIKYKNMQEVPNKILYGIKNEETNYAHYIRNMRIIHTLAEEMDIKFFAFLQPSLYCNTYGLSHSEKEIFKAFYKENEPTSTFSIAHIFYKNVQQSLSGEYWFHDMSNVFKDTQDGTYLDEIHYTNTGHQLIADYICSFL